MQKQLCWENIAKFCWVGRLKAAAPPLMLLRGILQPLADLLLQVLVREVEKKVRCDASFARTSLPLGAHGKSVPAF